MSEMIHFFQYLIGGIGGFVGLVIGWVIFPYTISFFKRASTSPLNLFIERVSGAFLGAVTCPLKTAIEEIR